MLPNTKRSKTLVAPSDIDGGKEGGALCLDFEVLKNKKIFRPVRDCEVLKIFLEIAEEVSPLHIEYSRAIKDKKMAGGELKADGSLVGIADKRINLEIRVKLKEKLSRLPAHDESKCVLVGEEDEDKTNHDQKNWDIDKTYYCFDPIDGTTNFEHGGPYSITMTEMKYDKEKKQWNSEVSVVVSPNMKEAYIAVAGKGSYHSSTSWDKRLKIKQTEPAQEKYEKLDYKAHKDSLKYCTITINAFALGPKLKTMPLYILLNNHARAQIGTSFAYDMADIARERHGVMFIAHKFNVWDMEAARHIIEEAGGFVSKEKINVLNIEANKIEECELLLAARSGKILNSLGQVARQIVYNYNKEQSKEGLGWPELYGEKVPPGTDVTATTSAYKLIAYEIIKGSKK